MMIDWNSPEEFAREKDIYTKLIHVLAGLYFWEYLLSLDFEWLLITRKRSFKWPMIFYLLNRYSALATVLVMVWIADGSSRRQIDCQVPITILQVFFFMSLILASINLAIRTIAIWSSDRAIVGFLVVLLIGQLVIMSFIKIGGQWQPHGVGCAPTEVPNRFVAALHGYPLAFDLVVFILACMKLHLRLINTTSGIAYVLFRDGLMYYIISFMANVVVVVLESLNLNTFMNSMFNIPAGIIVSVAATRAVRNLQMEASRPFHTPSTLPPHTPHAVSNDLQFAHGKTISPASEYTTHTEVWDGSTRNRTLQSDDMV
ncbi:hypothetical protein K474DRAFT_629485 [Panus rudis PR-1116 ss-1]|nr:hypothetical protein K474DRAFT_629485 [Panus rudis PR-1116 ss-1]